MSVRVAALVPARGGSKRLPRKNLCTVGGQTLLARAVASGRDAARVDVTVVSTEDDGIAALAQAEGAEVLRRPPELAGDRVQNDAVARHAIETLAGQGRAPEVLVLLQPTSPLRIAADIDATVALVRQGAPTAVTVCPPPKAETLLLLDAGVAPRRVAELGEVRQVNGAVYAARWDHLQAGGALIDATTAFHDMPWRRSVDIDTAGDLALATALIAETGEDTP